jgi:hypothetical protein
MKKFFIPFLITGLLAVFSSGGLLQAQNTSPADTAHYPYWTTMMQDPNANFHATQSAFEKYWAGRTDYRHNGWRVFKRWEYINKDRVQQNGKLQPPGYVAEEFRKYVKSHSPKSLSGNWTQVGPVNYPANATGQPTGMGRVNAIGFHPTDANTLYIGSPSGGFWKSTDGGATYTNLTSNLPTLGVSAILVHPTVPNTIFLGTGDRDAGDAPGMGVYKSIDGGITFTPSNTGMGTPTVGMMMFHPADPNTILAATSGGIYKSIDGGASWTKKSSNSNNYKDIKFKPGDPTIVYATENGKFYRSTNTGDSWTQITSGVIAGSRLVIGVSTLQPTYVYLLQTSGPFAGLLRSTDSGLTFTTRSTTPNIMDYSCDGSGNSSQAWYDLCMAVDPANANNIYTGGVCIWKNSNGGLTGSWTPVSNWVGASWGYPCAPSVHADIHVLIYSPLNGKLYAGCDGGVYYTANGGTSWTEISSGLAIAQVYKIGQSATNPAICINGYQDNGTASNSGAAFTTVIGGDGMECLIDYSDTNFRYGEYYYGAIQRTIMGNNYWDITNNITESGGWITPFTLHATIPSTMFAGYVNVWRSTNVKAASASAVNWTAISSGESGTCNVLEQSPANVDILYVARGGSLKRTDNANAATVTWTSCALPGGSSPTDLAAHPTNASIVYATAGSKVYKSSDKGATWTNISGTLPNIYINCIVYDKNSNEGLYIGNETSVYYKDASLSDWVVFNTGLPIVDVRELEIYYDASNPANNQLKAATYGRGLWQSDLFSALTVNPSNQNVPASPPGSTTFTVTASGTWTATVDSAWCTVTPSGSGTGTLTANYQENFTINQRIAHITVTGGAGPPVVVTVTQAGALPTLNVVPANQDVPAPAGITSFTVTSNTNWTAVCDSVWCVVTPSGSGNGTITANYAENFYLIQRIAHITVTVTGLPAQVVTVTQAAAPATLGVSPPNQDVLAPAGMTSFAVTSNSNWNASTTAPWCTVTPSGSGDGTIIANYQENTTYFQRVAPIMVTVTGLTPVNVTVTQAASTVSVEKHHAKGIQIYPNPSEGSFSIFPNEFKDQQMEVAILDITGRTIVSRVCRNETEYRFDLTNSPDGYYFVKIKSEKVSLVERLIIRK